MAIITNIEDLRLLAKRRVPKMFYDYVDSGSWTEQTYRDNAQAFADIKLRQRVGINIAQRSQQTRLLGIDMSMPLAIAPTGLAGMLYADGEILAARAAEKSGIRYTLSTGSICSIEDVSANTTSPFWFQLYMMRDRNFVERLIERATEANCDALVMTMDLQVSGQRHKDIKNGLSAPLKIRPSNLLNLLGKPRWLLNMARTRRHQFGNIMGHVKGVSDIQQLQTWIAAQFDPSLSWEDVAWVRERWQKKLIIKGVMDSTDVQQAIRYGADAVVVSNHGGRQLDGAPASIDVLPEIADAFGKKLEVWIDSGIRSGQDVFKAIALGAKGAMLGRAHLYGLGALGEPGVTRTLEIISNELDLTMAFCGCREVADITRQALHAPSFHSAKQPTSQDMLERMY